ncbi:MAG: YggS family pyridoxal phosphate enzyme [Deltaproteobacteria bacterium]|nr:YggS family pyridoxal phosphate enzyme [Deltaproteobacteria bacterium]
MIKERVRKILAELPEGVILVGAAKTRTPEEILEAVEGGLEVVGENYVQEAEKAIAVTGSRVKWHMIGHLQTNKAKKAVRIFDMIETVDSIKLAREIDKACAKIGKKMPVLIEINSGEEPQKSGVMPDEATSLIKQISTLENKLKEENIPNVEMRYLSMGMSNSYSVALEEGANMVRIGTKLFGERHYD